MWFPTWIEGYGNIFYYMIYLLALPQLQSLRWGMRRGVWIDIGVNWKVPPRPSGKRCSGNYKGGKIGRMDSLSRATRPPGDSDPISHVIINQIIHVKLAQEWTWRKTQTNTHGVMSGWKKILSCSPFVVTWSGCHAASSLKDIRLSLLRREASFSVSTKQGNFKRPMRQLSWLGRKMIGRDSIVSCPSKRKNTLFRACWQKNKEGQICYPV